jgi:hypothetical protein
MDVMVWQGRGTVGKMATGNTENTGVVLLAARDLNRVSVLKMWGLSL